MQKVLSSSVRICPVLASMLQYKSIKILDKYHKYRNEKVYLQLCYKYSRSIYALHALTFVALHTDLTMQQNQA